MRQTEKARALLFQDKLFLGGGVLKKVFRSLLASVM